MLVSRKALSSLVDITDITTTKLSELYNNYGGLEVEEIKTLVPQNKYIIGKILSYEPHPNADKLNVCQVDTGVEILEIVCGAPNVAQDKYVIVAPVGTTMPNGMTIEKREVRGVASVGMLCSLQEIGLEDKYVDARYKDGIYLFEDFEVTLGADVLETLGFATEIFDLGLTPDRSDCLSYRGLAYETAALCNKKVDAQTFHYEQPAGNFSIRDYVSNLSVTSDKVTAYNLIAYKNVTIKPAPQWMQSLLIASGVRPINNVVDITNYVMLMLGLPLHAFDGDKLPQKNIVVRQATKDEKIVTLDDKVRVLAEEDIVISTGTESIALAGVMGGANTEIDATTKTVILEAAIFDPIATRKTAVKFDLRSDASLRFEKGVDSTLPTMALALTSQLMIELAGAEVSSDTLSIEQVEKMQPIITCEYQKIAQRIGVTISVEEIDDILSRLSFEFENKDNQEVIVKSPTWRLDINIFEDVVEEVARLYGFEKLPNKLPIDVARPVFQSAKKHFLDEIHQKLQGQGLQEILTYTLSSKKNATLGQYKTDLTSVNILYPLSNDRETLRTTPYHSMIETLQYHYNRSFPQAAFYEVTDVYGEGKTYPVLSFGGYGNIVEQQLYHVSTAVDFYLLKGWLEIILKNVVPQQLNYRPTENPIFHPGVAADVYFEEIYLGTFGKIHPQTANELDCNKNLYFGEFRLNEIFNLETTLAAQAETYTIISKFPTIERDLALVTDRNLPVGELIQNVWKAAGENCVAINVFDIYTGEHIESTKKSVALKLQFNSKTETLTNEYVSQIIDAILGALAHLDIGLRK